MEKPKQSGILSVSLGEKLGVPHTFNPEMTVMQAIGAVAVAMTRIFLGSLLFALWGVCAWKTYDAIHNVFLRTLALCPIVVMFIVSMLALMIGINALAKRIFGKHV